jgi:hypothetical protein
MKPAVEAYKVVLDLGPRAAIAGVTPHAAKGKDDELSLHTLSLASDAAAAAIQLNQLETAVEFLEQARNALWAQELGLPSEVDKLERVNPHLAKHVRELALEQEKEWREQLTAPQSRPNLNCTCISPTRLLRRSRQTWRIGGRLRWVQCVRQSRLWRIHAPLEV